ncbi:hypothetical protein V3H47_08615 [Vibrio parahaemolyticus]|uniref:hypothetical protein n=1 Tax=Vibrio parahaemolyticus TaxID=670 RepID=UPI00132E7FC6|nr:hypothetical protein [Vibrio parahaemolyticus]MBE3696761.1 hypothetical protein [Vibrio parahaemolyticus]MBE3775898.1 hypothetical protein [Vibrio parahaemolyticus]QHH01522.1 hypothetical protein EHC64_20770 [Vibrio parahaemolyticus]QHH06635.1 hypothetical protein EHC66_20365 [Vibrio parahaemolyticus]HAS6639306.1 hypothetical protein [Vibrio parahaemolyticus]
MATLTKKERDWFNKLQKVLNECPFDTSDFDSYTIGDNDITVYKNVKGVTEHHIKYETDLGHSVMALNAEVFNLTFPFGIASASG